MGNVNTIKGDNQPPTGDFKKFNDKELSRLKKVFDALYERFPYKTISFETLYKTFPLPDYLKEHLAHALDTSNAEIIDFAPMLEWLTLYCQGSMQLKMEILFRMYGLGQMVPVNQEDLEALLRALMTPISKFFTLSDSSKVPQIGSKEAEYVNSMLKVIYEDHEINTDEDGKIQPQDYLDWQRENIHLVEMLERLLQNTRKKSSRSRDKSASSDRHSVGPEENNDNEENDMEGFLFKVGRTFGNWHERWFVLKGKFLYGYRTERDKNYNDIIHMTGYEMSKLDDKVGFYGFKLSPPESSGERSSTPKALYCKNETDRDAWVAALTAATTEPDDSGAPDSSKSARRVSSPRASPTNRHLKKLIRQDSENKLKILQKFLYRIETTQNRLDTLSSQSKSLKRHMGSSNEEEIQNRDRQIKRLEAKVTQLDSQLEFKNDFIKEMRSKFKVEMEEKVERATERARKESMAMIDFHTSKAENDLVEAHERAQAMQDQFQSEIFRSEGEHERITSNKISLIQAVSAEFSRLREYISELEGKLEAQKGWFF